MQALGLRGIKARHHGFVPARRQPSERPDTKGRTMPATLYPLNRTEFAYLALDGMAASFHQPYLMRLDRPVEEAAVRQAMRDLVSAFPRLRTVVVPGAHIYHFRVLPDDEIVDQLFDVAYRVHHGLDLDDPAAIETHQNYLVNEILSLERGLGVRMTFFPHPQRPMLHLGVHHMLADGRSMLQMMAAILRHLNGHPIEAVPMEAPSLMEAIKPARWTQWPRKLLAARRHAKEQQRRLDAVRVLQVPTRDTPMYSANAVLHHRLACSADVLRAHARRSGVSLNTLLVAALAEAFLTFEAEDPKAAAVIRVSLDLRRFFPADQPTPQAGNYVGATLVVEQGRSGLTARAKSVERQVRAAVARFEAREMGWAYLFEELYPILGRTLLGRLAWKLKAGGKLPRISVHATSLGDANWLNAPDARIRLDEMFGVVCSLSLLFVLQELNNTIFIPVAYQRCETEPEAIRAFLRHLDAMLLREVGQQPQVVAAAAA